MPVNAGLADHDRASFNIRFKSGHGSPSGRFSSLAGSRSHGLALLTADFIAAMLSFCAAFWIASGTSADRQGLNALLPWLGCVLAGLLLHLASHGHYARRLTRLAELHRALVASCGALLGTTLAAYLIQEDRARLPILVGWAVFPCLLLAVRAMARASLDAFGLWRVPVLLVGAPHAAEAASEALGSASYLGYVIAATLAPDELPRSVTESGWRDLLSRYRACMIVLAYDENERPPVKLVESLVRYRVPVAVLHETGGLPALACEQNAFPGHDTMMLCYGTGREKTLMHVAKSVLDVTLAALALIVLLPLFAVISGLIALDGGPVFFAHPRLGSQGRGFKCLKFRTMVQDSDAVLARLLAEDPAAAREWAATQKLRLDPRVTWIGRVLRKTSLDELPQLINVLRLEMSLVGPRPIVSREIARYADDISYYFETRPGITGLWQISGRNETTYARRVELDRWYVKNWSIGHDISILLRTIPAVLSGRGAS
jgi:undecaprenyl-phosphate galactose phosphotransferase